MNDVLTQRPVDFKGSLPEEQWRMVPGFEGRYAVSNHGRVLSLARTCDCGYGGRRRGVGQRLLKQVKQRRGGVVVGYTVNLSVSGNQKASFTPGRLVLMAFVSQPLRNQVARNIDGDRANNKLENLEWSTFSDIAIACKYAPPTRRKGETP